MCVQYAPHLVHLWIIAGRSVLWDAWLRRLSARAALAAVAAHARPDFLLHLVPLLRLLPVFLCCDPFCVNTSCARMQSVTRRRNFRSTHPLRPRTCHHLVPPMTLFVASSPPKTLTKTSAASSQQDMGTSTLTTCTHGGAGVRVFENF